MAAYDLNKNATTWDHHHHRLGRKRRSRPKTHSNVCEPDSDGNNSYTATTLSGETKNTTAPPKPSSSSNYRRKPDPSTATKITRPCSECGKRFWSWKALFGHMRCHPERQWRGINPPANFRLFAPPAKPVPTDTVAATSELSSEEREVAHCLVMLAGGVIAKDAPLRPSLSMGTDQRLLEPGHCAGGETSVAACHSGVDVAGPSSKCQFECSSCKRVFGSHQALGGYRASHKNVQGCLANANNEEEEQEEEQEEEFVDDEEGKNKLSKKMVMVLGHKCSVCLRVFSSGQALGGHKRCHWSGDENNLLLLSTSNSLNSNSRVLDLNLPAPLDNDLDLDLTLGI